MNTPSILRDPEHRGRHHSLANERVAVIGTGPIARRMIARLLEAQAKVTILSRRSSSAEKLRKKMKAHGAAQITTTLNQTFHAIINCTPQDGLAKETWCPLKATSFRRTQIVADINHRRGEKQTHFLKVAKDAHCAVYEVTPEE